MQLAGGLAALRIFMNCPAGGVRRVAGDLCGRQGFAVAHRDMRAERDGHQMIGDCAIQIVLVGKALVLQTEILHRAAVGHDPRALRQFRRLLGEPFQNVGNRVDVGIKVAAVDQLHLRRAFFRKMDVRVSKAGNRRPTFEVDRLRVRPREPSNVLGLAGGDDASAGAGEGFESGADRFEAADFSVEQNQIGIGRRS